MSDNARPSRLSSRYQRWRKGSCVSGCVFLNLAEYPFAVRVRFPHWSVVYMARQFESTFKDCHLIISNVNRKSDSYRLPKFILTFPLAQSLFIRERSSRRILPADKAKPKTFGLRPVSVRPGTRADARVG